MPETDPNAEANVPATRPLKKFKSIQAIAHKIVHKVGKLRALPRKVKLGVSFAGVMALLILLPAVMVIIASNGPSEVTYFSDAALDDRFAGTGMAGTAGNPYVFEGLTLSAVNLGHDLGWKWVYTDTTRHVLIKQCTFAGANQLGTAITLSHASNVIVEDCAIQGYGVGIAADHAKHFEVTGTTFLSNSIGIQVDANTFGSTFALNNFTRNAVAASDASPSGGNAWAAGGVGNYYDDYITKHPSAGITTEYASAPAASVLVASEPYSIGNHHDTCPLVVCPKGVPSLGIALPVNNSLHAATAPAYQVAASGWAITSVYYTIAGQPGSNAILAGQLLYASASFSGTINATAWAALGTGTREITFHATNWWGQETNQTVRVEKDVSSPSLLVTAPTEHAVFASAPPYALVAADPHLANISYQVGTSAVAYPAGTSGTIDGAVWIAQPDGDVALRFRANDTLGNTNETVVTVYKDITPPGLKAWFDAPGTNVTLHKAPPAFTLEVADPNFASAWYVLSGTSYPIAGLSGVVDGTAWGNQPDGAVTIAFHAIDSVDLETVLEVVLQKDTQWPVLAAVAPVTNGVHGASAPWFSLDVSEPNLAQVWYSLDGGAMNFTCGTQGYFYQGAWALLGTGAVAVDFWANDTLGFMSHLALALQKDISPPEITINTPTSSTVAGYDPFAFNVTITDDFYERAWYTLDGGISNYSMLAFTGTASSFSWAAVPAGAVTFQVFGEDYLGNIGTASVTFQRDLAPPNIELILPSPGTLFGNSSPAFNFHAWDQSLDRVWYQVGTGGPEFTLPKGPVVAGTVDAGAWAAQPDGNVYLYFHANDTAANHDCTAVLVVKDCTIPSVSVSVTGTLFGTVPPEVRCSIVDAHEDSAYYTLDQTMVQYAVGPGAASFTIDAGAWATLGEGSHILTLHGRDLAGNYANASVSFVKDITAPFVHVDVSGAGVYGLEPPTVTISVSDPHMSGSYAFLELETLEGLLYPVTITVNGITGNVTTQVPLAAWKHLYDGGFNLKIYYTDAANNTGIAAFAVGVDKTAPSLVVTTPSTGDIVGQDGVRFGLFVTDPHLSAVWYTIDGGASNYTLASQVGSVDPAAWMSVWGYGRTVVIQFYANDTCGNEACVTVVVLCEAKAPLWQRLGWPGGLPSLAWLLWWPLPSPCTRGKPGESERRCRDEGASLLLGQTRVCYQF